VQEALDELWPDDQDEPLKGLQQLQICPDTRFKVRAGPEGMRVVGWSTDAQAGGWPHVH